MIISLVVPVYNEQETVVLFYEKVTSYAPLQAHEIEIIFVNDGSVDQTASLVRDLMSRDRRVRLVEFTRNFGKEAAVFAGLEAARGDAVIPMDVDLQDPIEVVPRLIEKWLEGADVVLAKRSDRSADGLLKRKTAEWFYRFHNSISDIKIEENVGDFRLLSREVVDNILMLPEKSLFMRGVLSWPGGRTAIVPYARAARSAGRPKYTGWKSWNLALDGITSFSTVPLRVWTYVGAAIALLAFLYAFKIIIDTLVWGTDVAGYPSLMSVILFMGGVQLISVGVLGEYIGRIHTEVKNRPRYVVRKDR